MGLIRGSWRSSGVENENSFQYSCMEIPMDRGASSATVHGVTEIRNDQTHTEHTHTHTHTHTHIHTETQIQLYFKSKSKCEVQYE